MNSAQVEIQLIASVVAVACALPGVFLVLRRMSMMADAISHTVLLGIVLVFFVTRDINSPLLILGATATGVLTVSLVELLNRTRLVKEDAAIGLIFPALFSIAIILISRFAGDVHLDTDAVLLGELAFAPFERLELAGLDLGPQALWVMLAVLAVTVLFITLFYKELKLATFDAGLAAALGFSPALIHYGLMSLVSVTAVGAFEAVGAVLVVALMVGPAAAAYLLTDRLDRMLLYSALLGIASAISGYWLAHWLDASIAGSMATMVGALFVLVWLLAPERGLLAGARRRTRQRLTFAQTMLAIHLSNHEGKPEASQENRLDDLHAHLHWSPAFTQQVLRLAERDGLVARSGELLGLTEQGRQLAQQAIH
jgi:manganese/zinc/iron transport system permease protein